MKQIKLRIFDYENKAISKGITLEDLLSREVALEFSNGETLPLKDFLFYRNDFSDFMQYTGIKDKNGKEIYEGDIVRLLSKEIVSINYEPKYDYEILNKKGKWKTIGFYEKLVCHFNERELAFKFKYKNGDDVTLIDCDIEIIGNIFENPELLKAKI